MSNLLVIKGSNIGVKYPLGGATTIGRAPENTIQVADPDVSRVHCEIVKRGMAFQIRDKESRNGVIVNGQPVREKILLRNDEILVGSTAFLFNTDYDLKNTRFSNKRVYFSSPTDETVVRLSETAAPAAEISPEREPEDGALTNLILELGALFSSSKLPLPEALDRILRTLLHLFGADSGCLMVWDSVSAEFVPMVTVSERDEFAVSMTVIRMVMSEKQAILVPPGELRGPGRDELSDQNRWRDRSALCVPLLEGERVTGLIYLELEEDRSLLLHDVHLLQMVANLTQIAVDQSQTLDRMTKDRESGKEKDTEKEDLVGRSPAFQEALRLVGKVAAVDSTVLITGETGTGKEMVAREIHSQSRREHYPFIAVNCAAIPETLIESELFGHERGAFTGADRMRRGLIENAHGGTLFLDEIGEMSTGTQVKLLRFLQERVITRVGGHQTINVDVRVIAATNVNLKEAVEQKNFREDLMYRLNVFEIPLPPLRQRREDIHLLADHFARKLSQRDKKQILGFSEEAMSLLENYQWPGNIRELQNMVERAVLLCDGAVLEPLHFNLSVQGTSPTEEARDDQVTTLREAERHCILKALRASGWNQAQAARVLEIHRNTLHKKIQDLELKP